MIKTIEGRLSLSVFDSMVLAFIFLYLISISLANHPKWVSMLLITGLGLAVVIFQNRARDIVVKYDNQGIKSFRKTLRGRVKEDKITWPKVYGFDALPKLGYAGLIGKDGEVLLSLPTEWEGLSEFEAVVLKHLDERDKISEQIDFNRLRVKLRVFTPFVMTALSVVLVGIIQFVFFSSGESSLWQSIQFEVIFFLVVAGIALGLQAFRLTGLHIGKHELILKYPLANRRLKYRDIASAELVEDPTKPVTSEVRRLRINLKGRAKHYIVSEFPNRVDVIHRRINKRLRNTATE